MARSAMRRRPLSPARAVVVAKGSVTPALRVTTTKVERHAAAGTARTLAVPADLEGQRRADRRDRGRCLSGTDRLAGDPEVAHEHGAGPAALVEPVGAVPPDDGGEA